MPWTSPQQRCETALTAVTPLKTRASGECPWKTHQPSPQQPHIEGEICCKLKNSYFCNCMSSSWVEKKKWAAPQTEKLTVLNPDCTQIPTQLFAITPDLFHTHSTPLFPQSFTSFPLGCPPLWLSYRQHTAHSEQRLGCADHPLPSRITGTYYKYLYPSASVHFFLAT